MTRWWPRAATALLLLAVIVAALLAAAWTALPLEGTTISIDGESFSLANLSGGHTAAEFAIAIVAIVVALLVAALAVVLGLVAAVLGIGVGVLATVASLALVTSPFLLVGWLAWRAVRKQEATTTAAA